MGRYILAFDQGTTSSRAVLFDDQLDVVVVDQKEFKQIYPQAGWVEHDPQEIWQTSVDCARLVIERSGILPNDIAAIGITNQRETSLIWERETGEPLGPAIVWQDRRTADLCETLKEQGFERKITAKTGLLLDPYFSATKLQWMLDQDSQLRTRAENGELCFGTIDSWLMFKLSGGTSFKTDATNASRTMLYNIHEGCWDDELLEVFSIPRSLLAEVCDCAADFGVTEKGVLGAEIPICGVAGDQQAALIGQACFKPGMMKSTYGTGCFALINTGETPIQSRARLLTTIAYQFEGKPTYALEGSIFIAGAAVKWLRDELGLIVNASECDDLAVASNLDDPVCLVPAFAGLGAPYWEPGAKGALFGLTRGTGRHEIVRAALESVGYQTKDLIMAMAQDWQDLKHTAPVLRVDGGMVASEWTMQFLSDILQCRIERPVNEETTVLGAAYLAGLQVGLYPSLNEFAESWSLDKVFCPVMAGVEANAKYQAWLGWVDKLRKT